MSTIDKIREQVVGSDLVQELKKNSSNNSESESTTYLFISYDLVNSTKFKTKSPKWPMVVSHFYELALTTTKSIPKNYLWKYAGDEVLFFKTILDVQDLEEAISRFYEGSLEVTNQLQHGLYGEEVKKAKLSVKATAWLASAVKIPSASIHETYGNFNGLGDEKNNIIIQTHNSKGDKVNDFLGHDIDTGFRVSKFSKYRVMSVSAELARVMVHICSGCTKDKLRLVGYEKLKGIWDERRYPVIWYSNFWDDTDEIFEYDEKFDSDLVQKALDKSNLSFSIPELNHAFNGNSKTESSDKIIEHIRKLVRSNDIEESVVLPNENSLEVHCVAVCFNSKGEVLVSCRDSKKQYLPDTWEFGCAQLTLGKDFFVSMESHYLEDFKAELEFPYKQPFRQYYIKEKKIAGLIFIARVINENEIESKFDPSKHSAIRWIKKSNDLDKGALKIPEFDKTLKAAKKLWKENRSKFVGPKK